MNTLTVIGHISIDKIKTKYGTKYQLGGPPSYISAITSVLKIPLKIITKIGPDLPSKYHELFNSRGIDITPMLCRANTTRFKLNYTVNPRKIGVETLCEPIKVSDLTDISDNVILSPIVGEINDNILRELDTSFVTVDPQGFIRKIHSDNTITYENWKLEKLNHIDVLKTSTSEHRYLSGSSNIIKSLAKLHELGIGTAVITDGKNGAYVYSDFKAFKVPAHQTKTVDSTGAGDCFLAGLCSGIFSGRDVEWSSSLGASAASYIVETDGPFTSVSESELTERAEKIHEKITKFDI